MLEIMAKKLTQEEVIKRLVAKFGYRYDYSKVVYVNRRTKICICCKEHGVFYMLPFDNQKYGCPQCAEKERINHIRKTKEEFVSKAKMVHGNKYDYSEVIYEGSMKKVSIICPVHGAFFQSPNSHLSGRGCRICGMRSTKFKQEFVRRARDVHGDKYDYSNTTVKTSLDKVVITCPIHGVFKQQAFSHLQGCGCPECSTSLSKGENKISEFLSKNNIEYEAQYKIKNINQSCDRKNIIVDFYLKEQNIIIEYNGQQHYKEVEYFGGESVFFKQLKRDNALRQYCHEKNIKLIEIPYFNFDKIEEILRKELV